MASAPTQFTTVGNVTKDPELRYTGGGVAVVDFTVAVTPRSFNKDTNEWEDGKTSFWPCTAWRELAENIAATFSKGMRVLVSGEATIDSWDDEDGNKRSKPVIQVDSAGPELKYATAAVTRVKRGEGAGEAKQEPAPAAVKKSSSKPAASKAAKPAQDDDDDF